MNIHHLELFYYVARHGGISEAVRNIPYGIQQPAVSGQILQLEDFLGVTLFQRRPFALSPAGEKLYRYIEPFFTNLATLTTELQGGTIHQIRIGASEIVLRDHLPEFARNVRKKYPDLKITLREGYHSQLEGWLLNQEIDLAVTVTGSKPARGLHSIALAELPLILLVEKGSRYTSAEQLWKLDRIAEPLICLPAAEPVSKYFQQGLHERGIDWFPSLEASSLALITTYVANGFGIGLAVALPRTKLPPNVRVLPLPGFAPVAIGALWCGQPTPVGKTFLEEMQLQAKLLAGPSR